MKTPTIVLNTKVFTLAITRSGLESDFIIMVLNTSTVLEITSCLEFRPSTFI